VELGCHSRQEQETFLLFKVLRPAGAPLILHVAITWVKRLGPLTSEVNDIVSLRSLLRLLVTANVVPSSPILVTPTMEAIYSSETSVLTRRNIQEDGIRYSYRHKNFKYYIALTGWAL
jgi:hypothetical protein